MTTHKRVATVEMEVRESTVSLPSAPMWSWRVDVSGVLYRVGAERTEALAHAAAAKCAESIGPLWVKPGES